MRSIGSREEQRWTLMAITLLALVLGAILVFQLTVAFVAGMLVYTVVDRLAVWLEHRTHTRHARLYSLVTLLTLIAVFGSLAVDRAVDAAAAGGGYQGLLVHMASILEELQATLPRWLVAHVPVSVDALRLGAVTWLRDHASQVQSWGHHVLRAATYAIVGIVIGALALFQHSPGKGGGPADTPWVHALRGRFAIFRESFDTVVFAQMRVAIVNTILTAVYVLVVLPLIGRPLPLAGTLVGLTFVVGLIPIVGNLISNSAIVIVSVAQGLDITVVSMAFLVGIHKLEYFLNAQIVGERIRTRGFELLAVMLLLEAIFGLAGLVMAPILYAYVKAEMRAAGWL